MDLDFICHRVRLCDVCLVWGPVVGGVWWPLRLVPPGDWSTPPLTAATSPSRQTGSPRGTAAKTWISPCGDTDLSTFCERGNYNVPVLIAVLIVSHWLGSYNTHAERRRRGTNNTTLRCWRIQTATSDKTVGKCLTYWESKPERL